MFPVREYAKRLQAILEELDGLEAEDGEAQDAREERNAELEDAIMLFTEADADSEDYEEEIEEDLDTLDELCGAYAPLFSRVDGLDAAARRLRALIELIRANL